MSAFPLLEKNLEDGSEHSTGETDSRESMESLDYRLERDKRRGFISCLSRCKWLWAIHLALTLTNVALFVMFGERMQSQTTWNVDGALPYHSTPIEMVRTVIAPGGIHHEAEPVYNDYEGPPNARNHEAWQKLMRVGWTDLDDEEYTRLDDETALNINGEGGHVVTFSVFHQLHCINLLRRRVWDAESDIPQSTHPLRVPHLDHCLDYMRQIVMCNGDLTPATFTLAPSGKGYVPKFREQHQCRNFDKIYEWAEMRDNGVSIDPPLFE